MSRDAQGPIPEGMGPEDRLIEVSLATGTPARTPELQQEIDIALFDLAEQNRFRLAAAPGPYRLSIGLADRRIALELSAEDGSTLAVIRLPVAPLRHPVEDYAAVCAQYAEAVRHLPTDKIEQIDAARRRLHDAGAEILTEALQGQARTDAETARRLFTLIAALMNRA